MFRFLKHYLEGLKREVILETAWWLYANEEKRAAQKLALKIRKADPSNKAARFLHVRATTDLKAEKQDVEETKSKNKTKVFKGCNAMEKRDRDLLC